MTSFLPSLTKGKLPSHTNETGKWEIMTCCLMLLGGIVLNSTDLLLQKECTNPFESSIKSSAAILTKSHWVLAQAKGLNLDLKVTAKYVPCFTYSFVEQVSVKASSVHIVTRRWGCEMSKPNYFILNTELKVALYILNEYWSIEFTLLNQWIWYKNALCA